MVVTSLNLEDSIKISDFCHKQNIAMVRAEVRGVFASVFCDFGPNFRVNDTDGTCTKYSSLMSFVLM